MRLLLVFALSTSLAACGKSNAASVASAAHDASAAADASPGPFPGCQQPAAVAKCHDGFCLVPPGCFVMGSPSNEPYRGANTEDQRPVTLTHAILIAQHELTQGEWVAGGYPNLAGTMNAGAGATDCVASDCPASTMTWFEAVEFLNKKSQAEGRQACIDLQGCTGTVGKDFACTGYKQTTSSYYDCNGYRLFTGAEFQYAARAGTTTAFYSGTFEPNGPHCVDVPNLDAIAWYCVTAANRTHPVGQKAANAWGLYDMLGNVLEFAGSEPDMSSVGPAAQTDPYAVLNTDQIFGALGSSFVGETSGLRCAAQDGFVFINNGPRNKSMGAGAGFRVTRTLSTAEAAAW